MRTMTAGTHDSLVRWRAALEVDPAELDQAVRDGWHHDGIDGWSADRVGHTGRVLLLPKPNLVVDSGVHRSLDRLFNLGAASQLRTVGVDDGSANPTAGTSSSTAGSTNRRLVTFDSTPTRSGKTVTAAGTFTNANVAFVMKRLFLSAATAGTTDAAGDLYGMTNVFTIDLTPFSSWSQTFSAEVTGSGS